MGPRFFNRGNWPARTRNCIGLTSLQWGRGFSTAEILGPGRHPLDRPPASMGPRFFNRGNQVARQLLDRVDGASMGPRFFNRGNRSSVQSGHLVRPFFNGAAVFQPRKFPQATRAKDSKESLQWGRGFSTAEMASMSIASERRRTLQWGRGFSTAEIWGSKGQ